MMTPITNSTLVWAFGGTLFITIVGSTLHFAFAWSGNWLPVAVFAAVNESIWEHLKLAFWPGLVWAAIERPNLNRGRSEFWAVKGIALLVAPISIILVFTAYTSTLGRNILYLDIGTFIFAVALGQWVSAWLITSSLNSVAIRHLGHLLLAMQIMAYSTLTFLPPEIGLFMDSRNESYGIPAHSE